MRCSFIPWCWFCCAGLDSLRRTIWLSLARYSAPSNSCNDASLSSPAGICRWGRDMIRGLSKSIRFPSSDFLIDSGAGSVTVGGAGPHGFSSTVRRFDLLSHIRCCRSSSLSASVNSHSSLLGAMFRPRPIPPVAVGVSTLRWPCRGVLLRATLLLNSTLLMLLPVLSLP